ncbi:hypothetical protein ACFLQV_05055 [Calditrichota bacterium]
MRRIIELIVAIIFFFASLFVVQPEVKLSKTMACDASESSCCITLTSDSCFVVLADMQTLGTDWDAWLVKVYSQGEAIWCSVFGGDREERVYSL